MLIVDLVREVRFSIFSNKVRSGLTMLGIVIGIASVIAMVAIGAGAQNSIEAQIQSMGSNLLTVRPNRQGGPGAQVSSGTAQNLTNQDAQAIEDSIENIENVAPYVSGNFRAIAQGNNISSSVMGVLGNYAEVSNLEIETGTFLTDEQNKKMSKVAVIGPDVAAELFENDSALGQKIRINGIDFSIIGVTVAKGAGGMGGSPDETIYVPLTTQQQYLSGSTALSAISIQITEEQLMAEAQVKIENLLLKRHKLESLESADFRVMNQADMVATASSVTGTLTILLGAVAGISLVVGGIGIMNMMLTTVTERTREIGLRKAIGAKKKEISRQFLAEAIALTFIGGILGVSLGWLISFGVKTYAGLETQVSFSSVFLAFGVSALIGIVFGYYPAHRAARLNPIEALRYE